MRRSSAGELVPLDLEIEATFRRNNAKRKRKLLHDRTVASILEEAHFSESSSSSSPTSKESQTAELEAESKQLLDTSVGGKIKLKTPEEAMNLIENMTASDHTILHDRVHIPNKKSLLELSSQDSLLAQNKLLSKQLEALTETLSKLLTQLHASQSLPSSVLQVTGCTLYGGAHGSSLCIPTEETSHEVNYMGNQPRQNFNVGGFSGFQHGQPYQQQNQWRTHPGNQFNKDQGGPPNRPQQQRSGLYERTTKLEETLAQFMQVSLTNHKSTELAIKNLEVQVGQLAKQLAKKSSSTFGANIEHNPKEECKAVMT
ncbi:hypothetical protein GmHk_04G010632 [Glycine max]|nr:hypothetical protein GmHk_04G010632 [Glycine max]